MKKILLSLFILTAGINSWAYKYVGGEIHHGGNDDDRAAGCDAPSDIIYLEYNNVRALIMSGGMMWQDIASNNPSYIVANTEGAHVIYAGALWMGGKDVNDQLKLAAQRYGSTGRDFWTGPLSTFGGGAGNYDPSVQQTSDLNVVRAYGDANIIADECRKYDRFFTIRKTEVKNFISWWDCTYGSVTDPAVCEGIEELDPEILQRIKEWPAHGNTSLGQDYYLAPFFDRNGDGIYNPIVDGDYPWYDGLLGDLKDCGNDRRVSLFGDETNWWVFNDKGNIHGETGGEPIGMEVHAQAFAFGTSDAINDMTFYNYEMINRSTQTLQNTYFAQYVDPDIGGAQDDYVGCDVSRGLGYCYNGDPIDDFGSSIKFGEHPPAIGIDFFEGPYQDLDNIDNPLTTNIQDAIVQKGIPYKGLGIGYGDSIVDNERLGMRRFIYYNNSSGIQGDPNTAADHYGLMDGFWKTSGVDITYGGTGLGGSIKANYMFPGDTDPYNWGTNGLGVPNWSEETENNAPADRRFVEVAGPFTLYPGAVNNITVGVVYGRDEAGDNIASVDVMKKNDTKAQALFDACFEIVEPPYAPDLTIQEMENELIIFISDKGGIIENYKGLDKLNIPADDGNGNAYDQYYRFQGYQIYQMVDADASVSDIGDETKAKLVAQCDLQDNITQIINYEQNEEFGYLTAEVKVPYANNEGIQHTFRITEDAFAQGDKKLVNHKKYYFVAIAYAFNEYKPYDPTNPQFLDGQQKPYISSRQTINGGSITSVEGIPHNPTPEAGGTVFGTEYGYQPSITRIDGIGNGGNFVEIDSTTEANILANNSVNEVTYKVGAGPVNVKVVDPLNLQNGTYTIGFASDATEYRGSIADSLKWFITRQYEGQIDTVWPLHPISERNEFVIPEWGLSVDMKQLGYLGKGNSVIGYTYNDVNDFYTSALGQTITYEDSSKQWLSQVTDNDLKYPTNWVLSGNNYKPTTNPPCNQSLWIFNECIYYDNQNMGEDESYEKNLDGIAPLKLVNTGAYGTPFGAPFATYGINGRYASFQDGAITNANMVRLHDVDIVITSDQSKWTRCPVVEINDNVSQTEGNQGMMLLRKHPSVDKNGNPDGTGEGMGWFPGYAIDLETGDRLNMAFSENSWLPAHNGQDMIWNPTSKMTDPAGNPIFGGMQYVYVFGSGYENFPTYDQGARLKYLLEQSLLPNGQNTGSGAFRQAYGNLQWIWMPVLNEGHELMETDVRVSVRINKPYSNRTTKVLSNNGRPLFSFEITDDIRVITNDSDALLSALDLINIVPNPYYAFSEYEANRLDTRVKLTNLPEKCEITIFNMQGALVRQYSKDDPMTSLEWDLKNHKGIPIAGGVYIIHINVPDVGEKIIKWYGVMRAPDLQGF